MTLLTLVQNVTDQIGLPRPTAVIGSQDQTIRTLLSLANREGKQLAQTRDGFSAGWPILQKEHTFTTTASTAEYSLPDDFSRLIDNTAWDRTNYWNFRGPLSPQEWQTIKSGLVNSVQLRRRFRVKRSSNAKKFFIDPTPSTTGDNLVFEYISDSWAQNAAGDTFYTAWNADTDTGLLDEDLMEMGVVWRFKMSKGLAFATDLSEYEQERDRRMSADGGGAIQTLTQKRFVLPVGNVPESGFGS